MADYPKFTFDKSRIPDFPPELSEDFKEYAKRQMQYLIPPYDDLAPKMSFQEFRRMMSERCNVICIDEITEPCPKPMPSVNPEGSQWYKIYQAYLNGNDMGFYKYDPNRGYKDCDWTAEVQFDLNHLSEKRNMEALAIIDECKGKSLPYLLNKLSSKGLGGEIGTRMMLPPIIRLREKENG